MNSTLYFTDTYNSPSSHRGRVVSGSGPSCLTLGPNCLETTRPRPSCPGPSCRWAELSVIRSYIAQYPVLRTVQSALRFTSLTDLFTQTPSRLLWEASCHMLQLMREDCSYTYPPLSIGRYSFVQLSELEQCRVKTRAQGFNTAARIRTRVLVVESPKLYP